MLEVSGLQVRYGKSLAVHRVNLEVGAGEIVALLGRNGAGKSTTFKAIMHLVPPAAGTVVLDGRNITRLEAFRVARLGLAYVPEERRVFSNLTVKENLRFAAIHGAKGQWTLDRVYELFPVLADHEGQAAGTLSGGEQQMLAIGRALAANPKVILLDEPLEGLAPSVAHIVAKAIVDLKDRGMTIVLVEQNVDVALRVADRGYVLELGEVVMSGTGEALRNDREELHRYLSV
jgi:branched-chain amino acid transport system ATP-binding protein